MASKLDELMALAEEFGYSGRPEYEFDASARADLQSALKAVVEDAERYQWLRDKPGEHLNVWYFHSGKVFPSGLDAAIDAARKP